MNILLINHYAGSIHHGMEYRPYYLAREWQKIGHKVTILAASEAHVRSKKVSVVSNYQLELFDGVQYIWLKTNEYDGNGFKRALNMASFIFRLFQNFRTILKLSRPDVVIASSTYPADIFPAKFLADKCQAKLVYEVHDLWPLSPIELGGMSRFHPFILLMQFAEDFAYKYANVIVSMLPKTLDHMKSRGLQSKKWFYIPNGICLKDWEKSSEVSEKLLKLISNEKDRGHFLIAYCGAHGLANSLLTLIKAAKLSLDLPVTFFLIGKGPEKEELIKEVENLNLNNVVFIDHVSKSAIPKLLPNFDALYIGLKKQSLFRFGISPNKLIDYMMSGRPVIQAINAGNDMVKEADCGYSIEPENPKEIVNAIKKLLTLSDQERSEMGLKGKQYVIANHDYRKLAVKFAELLLNI